MFFCRRVLNSAVIAGLANEGRAASGHSRIAAVTLGFEELRGKAEDEVPNASELAAYLGVEHSVRMVGRAEFEMDRPALFAAMDQPTIDGVNTWFVSKAMRERGFKVALSGLGGDELFGGYPSFRDIPRLVRAVHFASRIPGLGTAFRSSCQAFDRLVGGIKPKLPGLIEYGGNYPGAYFLRRGLFMPWELSGILGDEIAREGLERLDPQQHIADALSPDPRQPFARVAALEASLYMGNQLLRDTDWASMAHSLEVRVPLVDVEVAKSLAPLLVDPNRASGKELLAMCAHPPLPANVSAKPKTGFMTPVNEWTRGQMSLGPGRATDRKRGAQAHWSREWALAVLAEMGLGRGPSGAPPNRVTAQLELAS